MKQSRKKWFVAAICIIVVLALGTGGVIYYKKQEQQKKLLPTEYVNNWRRERWMKKFNSFVTGRQIGKTGAVKDWD